MKFDEFTELEIARDALHCAQFYRETEQCHGMPLCSLMGVDDRVAYWEHHVAILEALYKSEHSDGPAYKEELQDAP